MYDIKKKVAWFKKGVCQSAKNKGQKGLVIFYISLNVNKYNKKTKTNNGIVF